jgi:hypothetical protein
MLANNLDSYRRGAVVMPETKTKILVCNTGSVASNSAYSTQKVSYYWPMAASIG